MNRQERGLDGLATSVRDTQSIIENQGNVANQAWQQTVYGGLHITQSALAAMTLSPTSTVPFRRDLDFIVRGNLLDQIDRKCSAPASRVALVGLGGIG